MHRTKPKCVAAAVPLLVMLLAMGSASHLRSVDAAPTEAAEETHAPLHFGILPHFEGEYTVAVVAFVMIFAFALCSGPIWNMATGYKNARERYGKEH